jgi:hypothetical protein
MELVDEARRALPGTAAGHTEPELFLEQSGRETSSRVTGSIEPAQTHEVSSRVDSEPIQPGAGKERALGLSGEAPDARGQTLAAEGIYVRNAGMVILHPFLPRFFETLGIAAEDKLLQPERALWLLHFLTTGQLTAPEYELMLPKILCTVPLETPVESDVVLTETEQREANTLLEAVIRHWKALKSTSPDGLRGTFLVRHGKVSPRDGDWLLQVEAKTWDVLLDQLPWGISVIRLPWMNPVLWVEWR